MGRNGKDPRRLPGIDGFTLVFLPGGKTTAYVSFLFVFVQNISDLNVQQGIGLGKSLLQILMYRRFGDTEVICCGADGGTGLDHVHSQSAGSLFNSVWHHIPPMLCAAQQPMQKVREYALTGWKNCEESTGLFSSVGIYYV